PAAFLPKNRDGVLVGLSRVDDDRPLQVTREANLRAKDRALHVSGREVVVVVETDLADRARRRHRLELRADCIGSLLRLGRELVRLVWMNADGKADVRPEALDSVRLRRFLLVCCGENDERALDARFTRTS